MLKDALVEKTKNYLMQGKKVGEIANILGVGESTIKLWIKKNDLEKYWVSKVDTSVSDEKKAKIFSTFIKLKGIVDLEKKFHIYHENIKKILNEVNFKVFKGSTIRKAWDAINGETFRPINSEVKEMMDGMMLGDAHIEVMLKTVEPQISDLPTFNDLEKAISDIKYLQTTTDQDWTRLSAIYNNAMKVIEEYPTARFNLGKALLETNWLNTVSEKLIKNNYPTYISKNETIKLTSKSTFQMFEQRQRWYPNGTKIVPRNLKMTSNVALGWFVDDGTLTKYQVRFATDCFTKAENEFLGCQLYKEAQIETHIYEHKDPRYPGKIYYSLYISKEENLNKFFSYLEKADKDLLDSAKKEFPWKFDRDLKKKDVIK